MHSSLTVYLFMHVLYCTLAITQHHYSTLYDTLHSFTPSMQCDAVEHVPVVVVLAVDSVDLGANAEVEYMFISGDTPRFTIDSTTGRVRLAGTTWDFESGMTSFTVTVGATDNPSGSPQLSVCFNDVYQSF